MSFSFNKVSFSSFGLMSTTLILFSLGLLMVYNTTSAEALDFENVEKIHIPLVKQLSFALIGLGASALLVLVGFEKLYEKLPLLTGIITILLILVLIPKVGMEINGAKRWIRILGISFQPSEFAKIIIPVFFIKKISGLEKNLPAFLKYLTLIFVPIFFILAEPDNGTVAIIIGTLITIFFLVKIPMKYWLIPLLCFVCIGTVFAIRSKHVHDRIRVYLHPEEDLLGKGHQPYQAKIAAGSGGIHGKGFGNSFQKLNYLPEARSDYIAAIFAEEFGFIGIAALITLYLTFVAFGFNIAFNSSDEKGFYVASILTFLIGFQAFLNLGVVSGLLPSKGTNLPFFSQGGSSLCSNFLIVALLINIDYISAKKRNRLII